MEGCGVGEVRRANIVYFLSREGKVEHPHLISVHHFHSNAGVQLRDVKRWLSEQRGKDLPDSFAWSYKRRYRTGYVWQDLKEDDVITPISDNEYVLKGSRIPSSPSTVTNSGWSSGEKTPGRGKMEMEPEAKTPAEILEIEPDDTLSPKPPPQLDLDSSDPERCSDEMVEQTAVFKMDLPIQRVERKREDKRESLGRSSTSRRASQVFRSILTCGLVATNESALLPIGRRERDMLAGGGGGRGGDGSAGPLLTLHQSVSANSYRKTKSTSGGKTSTVAGEKAGLVVCRPAAAPNCSQCGKAFRPEKLHSHMKSCKALKG